MPWNRRVFAIPPTLLNFSRVGYSIAGTVPRLLHPGALGRRSSTTAAPSWTERLPIIIRPSFWRGLIPKPLRRKRVETQRPRTPQQEWNPATYFILIFLLIGSNGIHFVNLKRTYAITSRQADSKVVLLQEVLKKIQKGEDVDVEKVLGTGDPLAEQEWHDVLRKIEEEDRAWQDKNRTRDPEDQTATGISADDVGKSPEVSSTQSENTEDEEVAPRPKRNPGFY